MPLVVKPIIIDDLTLVILIGILISKPLGEYPYDLDNKLVIPVSSIEIILSLFNLFIFSINLSLFSDNDIKKF